LREDKWQIKREVVLKKKKVYVPNDEVIEQKLSSYTMTYWQLDIKKDKR